ncbi:MAG: MarR family transcriptional regulator [Solirubrobacteraceae bacterium]
MAVHEVAPTEAELAAWKGFLRVHAAMRKALDAELEAEHGLSLSSFEVLSALRCSAHGRLRMADLAEHAQLSRSGMTRLVDRLERLGWLTRCSCSDDARGCFAVLSAAGAEVIDRARPTHRRNVRERFLRHCDDDDLARLTALFDVMLAGEPA